MFGQAVMAVKEILQFGDVRLTTPCEKVEQINEEVLELVQDMKDTLYAGDGIGLAAPQIGVLKRVILIDLRDGSEAIILVNPKIVAQSGEEKDFEGCLSYVGYEGEVIRPTEVTVIGTTLEGEEIQYTATDLLARAFCHEIDHLDGILYTNRAVAMYEIVEE